MSWPEVALSALNTVQVIFLAWIASEARTSRLIAEAMRKEVRGES